MFADKYRLTWREKDVFRLILLTGSIQEIGNRLYITKATLKTHLWNIYSKCGVHSMSELMAKYFREVIQAEARGRSNEEMELLDTARD